MLAGSLRTLRRRRRRSPSFPATSNTVSKTRAPTLAPQTARASRVRWTRPRRSLASLQFQSSLRMATSQSTKRSKKASPTRVCLRDPFWGVGVSLWKTKKKVGEEPQANNGGDPTLNTVRSGPPGRGDWNHHELISWCVKWQTCHGG